MRVGHSLIGFRASKCGLPVAAWSLLIALGAATNVAEAAVAAACCHSDGTCTDIEHDACAAAGGDPYPVGTLCANVSCQPLYWARAPVTNPDGPVPQCFWAWEEPSVTRWFALAADEFTVSTPGPITAIHWWGAYRGWQGAQPAPGAPPFFHLAIWSHVPADQGDPYPWPHPGTVLREWVVNRADTAETVVGCGLSEALKEQGMTVFRYEWDVPESEWLTVGPAGATFWLSIGAAYVDPDCACSGDVTTPAGTPNAQDVAFINDHIGCPVGTGDPACDAADVDCDGDVDTSDRHVATCQQQSAWLDPFCCAFPGDLVWGWLTHEFDSAAASVLIGYPTTAHEGESFTNGQRLLDAGSGPWDFSFVLVGEPNATTAPEEPLAEPGGVGKCRYLGILPNPQWANAEVALRVRLVQLDRFGGFNGQVRWVGHASQVPEHGGPVANFMAAPLQCTPHFENRNASGAVQVFGSPVVPSSLYEVQAVDRSCENDLSNPACYSTSLALSTAKWGDTTSPFGGASQPNFSDVTAAVDKFRNLSTALPKARIQMQPNVPNPAAAINFADISSVVDGFRNFVYPFAGPSVCP